MAIKKIINPYIPDTFDGSLSCCCNKQETEVLKEIDVSKWLTKYTELKFDETHRLRSDTTGAYTPQGGCVYGAYIYRALVKEDNEPAIIQKIRIMDGSIVAETNARAYGHANDLFIKNGKLYVLHSSSTNIVYELNADTLEYIQTLVSGPTRWGQAYNSVDGVDVIGTVGSAYFSVYLNGEFMFRIKPDNAFSGLVRQGIFCSDNYVGVVLDNAYGAQIENEKGSRVMFYTWNGMFIKSVFIPINEIEWADYQDGTLYFGTYEGRDENNIKHGNIFVVPFDLYPEQTVQTGRPTDVSGGLDNLQRLPEGAHVQLWKGEQMDGTITLATASTRLHVDEGGPFRYLKFKFDGANSQVADWYPIEGGTIALREMDVTAAVSDSTIRHRETRLKFNSTNQTFTFESCIIEEIKLDASENKITITKNPAGVECIRVRGIWGII